MQRSILNADNSLWLGDLYVPNCRLTLNFKYKPGICTAHLEFPYDEDHPLFNVKEPFSLVVKHSESRPMDDPFQDDLLTIKYLQIEDKGSNLVVGFNPNDQEMLTIKIEATGLLE